MSGGEAGRGLEEREARPGARRLWPGRWHGDSPERHLPQPGMEVGGYRLEAKLGTGGQGTVFRAWREGRLYAVKFIYLPHSAHWAWRELGCLVRLWRAGSLPLEGHGQWPARRPLFLFIVTPYVHGRPLDQWVRENNPTAREVAELVKGAAGELEAVHAAGVVHRDVKGPNFLVCQEGGRPVLVDFGVGSYEGAPEATGPFPPGTWMYLSPQVWRAWRETGHHRATPGDDVWALGVELYWLLTGTHPFEGREGELVHAILHQEPRAPHELNPRVPRALGEVCLRMLRKEPEQRYADARAVKVAVEAELEKADAAWEVPLCEAWGPSHATTEHQEELAGWDLMALYSRLAAYAKRPVRGRPRPSHEVSTLADSGDGPPGPEVVEPPAPRRSRGALWAAGAVLVLGACVWLAVRPAPRTSAPVILLMETPRAPLPPKFYPITWEPGGQEVAPPWKQPEGDGGTAPQEATTPVPVASAMHPTEETLVKTARKAPDTQQVKPQPEETGSRMGKAGALAFCTVITGCTGPTASQVRPTPLPTECPPGAVRTMKELGVPIGKNAGAEFPGGYLGEESQKYLPVHEGPGARVETYNDLGKLPAGTVLTGDLFFGKDRIIGRFTQAHTPGGETYPVCMVLTDRSRHIGVGGTDVKPGSGPGTARIAFSVGVTPVERFE